VINETLLEIDGITKVFGGLVAVSGLSFRVRRGQIKAIIGPNGAGKTTCLNLINGIYLPTNGEITFKGQAITDSKAHVRASLGIGRTFQNTRLFTVDMTVLENVMAGRHIRTEAGITKVLLRWRLADQEYRQTRKDALRWLEFVGLLSKADLRAEDLTFAEQRALELARALAGEPELLLVDEFAAGLHVAETENASKQFLKIRDELGISICLVEHNMELVMNTADDILVINYGKKLAEGPPAEIQRNQDVIEAYLGEGMHA